MSDEEQNANNASRKPIGLFVMAGIAIVVLIVGLRLVGGSTGEVGPSSPEAGAEATASSGAAVPADASFAPSSATGLAVAPSTEGLPVMEAGGSLDIKRTDLPDGPLVIGLKLGLPHDAEPVSVRIAALSRDVISTEAFPAGNDGSEARLEIPRDFLKPGQYLIMVRVRERSHLPGRRYVLTIR